MLFLYENVAPITVALSASLVAWLFGGARGDLIALVVPWLCFFVLEVLVFFPQRMQGESLYAARSRVWRDLGSSGIAWISLGFVCLLVIPFVNKGLCPSCDAAAIAAGADCSPPIPFLPSCVDRRMHLTTFLWFVFVLSSVLVMRHALQRDGRRLVLSILVWNGVALSLLGFVQGMTNAPGPFWMALSGRTPSRHTAGLFFSVFGYPNMAGDYFTLLFGISVALWRARCEKLHQESLMGDWSEHTSASTRRFEKIVTKHYLLIPATLFFFSALCTRSRAAILLVSTLACVYFLHTLALIICRMERSRRIVVGVWGVVVFFMIVFFAVLFMPQDVRKEVDSLDSYEVLDRMTGKQQHHVQVANAIWTDHFLFGCGGWGYAHFCEPKVHELKLPRGSLLQQAGSANVHNDYLQFLAEHGLVGFACLAAIVIILLVPVFRQVCAMYRTYRFQRQKRRLPKPIQIFIIPSPVFIILLACLATLIHAFGDCPLRSLAILDLLYLSIAALPSFMP